VQRRGCNGRLNGGLGDEEFVILPLVAVIILSLSLSFVGVYGRIDEWMDDG